jgi:hypothetical protein
MWFGLVVIHQVKEVMYSFLNIAGYDFVKMVLFNVSGCPPGGAGGWTIVSFVGN